MRHRALSFAAAVFALAALAPVAPAQAQKFRTVAKTGLFTLFPGHSARLHLVQLAGPPVQLTQVTLRLLDDRGRQVGVLTGELRARGVLHLTVQNPISGDRNGVLVRGEATLITKTNNFGTMPFLTLELVDEQTLTAIPAAACPIPYDPRGPTGPVGDSAPCGCELVNDFVS
jgi:hypothetical protein